MKTQDLTQEEREFIKKALYKEKPQATCYGKTEETVFYLTDIDGGKLHFEVPREEAEGFSDVIQAHYLIRWMSSAISLCSIARTALMFIITFLLSIGSFAQRDLEQKDVKLISTRSISGVYVEKIKKVAVDEHDVDSIMVVVSFANVKVRRYTETIFLFFQTKAELDSLAADLITASDLIETRRDKDFTAPGRSYKVTLGKRSPDLFLCPPSGGGYCILSRKKAIILAEYLKSVKIP